MIYISDPGSNWNGNINMLKELALNSLKSKATHFKPQIYDASVLYSPKDNPYYELQQKCSLSFEQVKEIHDYCKKIGIKPMFSCFNEKHLQWIEDIGCNTLKIGASMAGNKSFISEASNYGFDVFVSFSKEHPHLSVFEYQDMFSNAKFMSCVSKYPADICDYNLREVAVLKGISDHTDTICLSVAASAVGCNTFERHVWYRWHNTPDISSSIHIHQFENMVKICNEIASIR